VIVLVAFALTIHRLSARRADTWLAVGMLGLPIAWALSIGQAQVIVTLLTTLAAPWSIALAANVKLFPALVALWWIGRREWRALRVSVAWASGLALHCAAPQATSTS
jgi:hypothetical protein